MKKINFKYQVAAGVTLIIIGTLALLSNYIKDKRDVVFSEMNLTLSQLNQGINEKEQDDSVIPAENLENHEKEEKSNNNYTYEEYLGIIEIPKINLYKGFYSKSSNLNNVKFNLYVLPESNYPNVNKGNLIIAGHSGNYNNSYFKDLYKLVQGDKINIYYNNSKYTYKIVNIYNEEKTGMIKIIRDSEKTILTLITCTKDDEYHQTIYIAELEGVN
ncbi:MAG: sortase [Bacilli bacterium]